MQSINFIKVKTITIKVYINAFSDDASILIRPFLTRRMSVRLSVCLAGFVGRTISSGSYNLVQLISIMREIWPLVFKAGGQKSRSYCHIVGKRCTQDEEKTVTSRIILLNTINHHDNRKFKVGSHRSKSYCHMVGKRGSIHCMQDTDWTISSRILFLNTID